MRENEKKKLCGQFFQGKQEKNSFVSNFSREIKRKIFWGQLFEKNWIKKVLWRSYFRENRKLNFLWAIFSGKRRKIFLTGNFSMNTYSRVILIFIHSDIENAPTKSIRKNCAWGANAKSLLPTFFGLRNWRSSENPN